MSFIKINRYKHLKLDKFVSGKEQRIFKTSTTYQNEINNRFNSGLDTELEFYLGNVPQEDKYKNLSKKDVYYAEYSAKKQTEAKIINDNNLSGHLINFHDLNADYITNRPDKNKVLSFNRYKKSLVSFGCKKCRNRC